MIFGGSCLALSSISWRSLQWISRRTIHIFQQWNQFSVRDTFFLMLRSTSEQVLFFIQNPFLVKNATMFSQEAKLTYEWVGGASLPIDLQANVALREQCGVCDADTVWPQSVPVTWIFLLHSPKWQHAPWWCFAPCAAANQHSRHSSLWKPNTAQDWLIAILYSSLGSKSAEKRYSQFFPLNLRSRK